jgi:VanZ family protein
VKIKIFLPAVLWTALIFTLSSVPAASLHLPAFWDLFSLDKLAHASFYAVLFLVWHYSLKKNNAVIKRNRLLQLLICCMAYGGLLELFQGYCLINRTADWVDELANTIGASSAFIYIVRKRGYRLYIFL